MKFWKPLTALAAFFAAVGKTSSANEEFSDVAKLGSGPIGSAWDKPGSAVPSFLNGGTKYEWPQKDADSLKMNPPLDNSRDEIRSDLDPYIKILRDRELLDEDSKPTFNKVGNRLKMEFTNGFEVENPRQTEVIIADRDSRQQDLRTEITAGVDQIIFGNDGYKNIASLDSSTLPEGVKFKVFDAGGLMGACGHLKGDTSLEDAAKKVQGKCLVLYKEGEEGRLEVVSSVFLPGGESKVIVNGKEIQPEVSQLKIFVGAPRMI